MDGFEFFHGGHACEFEGVIFVGLAFDVRPFPGIFIGGTDKCLESEANSEIVDPTGRPTGFHDDQIDFVFLEDGSEVISFGGCV